MIDLKQLRADPERYRTAALNKRIDVDVDSLLELESEQRRLQSERQRLLEEKNSIGKQIGQLASQTKKAAESERATLQARMKELRSRPTELKKQERALDDELARIEPQVESLLLRVPQPPDDEVPIGEDDSDNVELRRWGEPRSFDFEPLDHVTLGQNLGIIDSSRGVKLAGARSYFLRGAGVLMHQAVLRLAFDTMLGRGFEPLSVPAIVRERAMQGTGYLPIGRDQCYAMEEDPICFLIGTAEVSLTAYHMDEILDESDLPRRYVAVSPCYRREAGTYGKDTAGLYRIHQFEKVEQVVVCRDDEAESRAWHEKILDNAETVVKALELPYRVVHVCTGDLGQGQVAKYDIETWMPSRDAYCETHSASRFYDFQTRRLALRYREESGRTHFCHTLNNTVIASPRILIPLLELNQNSDGSVSVPLALRPYMGDLDRITPPSA